MLDDVAAYLVLAPIAVIVIAGIGVLGWRLRGRAASVRVETTRH